MIVWTDFMNVGHYSFGISSSSNYIYKKIKEKKIKGIIMIKDIIDNCYVTIKMIKTFNNLFYRIYD